MSFNMRKYEHLTSQCPKEITLSQKSLSRDHNQYSRNSDDRPATVCVPNGNEVISKLRDDKLHCGRKVAIFFEKFGSADELSRNFGMCLSSKKDFNIDTTQKTISLQTKMSTKKPNFVSQEVETILRKITARKFFPNKGRCNELVPRK